MAPDVAKNYVLTVEATDASGNARAATIDIQAGGAQEPIRRGWFFRR